MSRPVKTISKKITLLNKTILDSMLDKNNIEIIKNFTELGIEILEANFGFAWWKFADSEDYQLAYKSPTTPYTPTTPRKTAGNSIARKTKQPFFDSNVKRENYEFEIDTYLKSYIIIPIHYGDNIYGSLVLCYKKPHKFTNDELVLASAMGNSTAQAITIHRLADEKRQVLITAAKQKAKEVLLGAKHKATELLLTQEKLKTEFIANTTHEFRTPLAIMRGEADLAIQSKKPAEALRALKMITTEINHLAVMIADLVLITSEKNVNKEMSLGLIDVARILNDTVKRLKSIAAQKNIVIHLKTTRPKLLTLGDDKHLERLFLNLIENAITYSNDKKGIIKVNAEEKKGYIIVAISDNGIGISKEDLPNIFERFYRGDKAHNSYGRHSGLGLALAKWVTEIHGGKIEVKSTLNVGTTFTISLPKVTISRK